jgi:asparaginyl-tRNA synthetase
MKRLSLTIEGKKINIDFSQHFSNLVLINQSLNFGAWENYQKQGLTYVDVPEIVGITGACENIDTLFKIQNRLDLPLFLTQTGQLALEQSLQSCHGVYTVIYSGRDEEKEDERHLRQFRLTEEEFDCSLVSMNRQNYDEEKMFTALLSHIQSSIQAMLKRVLHDNKEMLQKVYKRNIEKIIEASEKPFFQIKYEEAISLLNKKGKKISFGDDLKAEDEAIIVKSLNKKGSEIPVFITHYPKEIKFFNMKVYTKDPRVVLSADLIFPYAGEGTGSAVREHDFERLNERLLTSTMFKLHVARGGKYEDFKWYLDIIKNELTLPHAGYGIGNERVLQYIFGESDIRNVSLFSLLANQTGDWDISRYGQSAILTSKKRHILLTIGRIEDKKRLLPYIKKIAKHEEFILYATENTHLFLAKHGIKTSLVYKISEIGKNPNIADLLTRKIFDLIINIPRRKNNRLNKKEFTDGRLIRKAAISTGVYLVTDLEVATEVLTNLAKKNDRFNN